MKLFNLNKILYIAIVVFFVSFAMNGLVMAQIYHTSNGNVGIGTSSPKAKLDVNGLLNVTQIEENGASVIATRGAGNWNIGLFPRLGQGGYNGISSKGDAGIIFSNGAIDSNTDFVIAPWANGTSGIKIKANGNVGIGVENPLYKLTVTGTTNLSRDGIGECCSNGDFTLSLAELTHNQDGSINTGHRATIQFHNGWEAEGFIRLAGGDNSQPSGVPGSRNIPDRRFIFGSYQDNMSGEFTGNLYVGGSALATEWKTASDARLKKNITTINGALDKVSALRGVEFEWRKDEFPDKGFAEGRKIGLIAQEVEKVLPQVVSSDNDGYKSVEYVNMVAVLIEAVKELKMQNKELQARIEVLEGKHP